MFKQKYRFEIDQKNKIITLMPRKRDLAIGITLGVVSSVAALAMAYAASE